MKFKIVKCSLFCFGFLLLSFLTQAQNVKGTHQIIIQLNTADTSAWSSTIGNIKNIQKIWPNNLQIEVVVHGKAIDFLVKDKTHLAKDIEALTKDGIQFSACENTMRKHGLDKSSILSFAQTVPSGVVEVISKQEQGWSYLKAGVN
jgi:intracellular sulfur oxidation DsrE/DsrF family protein